MADGAFPKLLARRETLARRRLELVIVGAVRVTVANASDRERAASEGYSIFRRNPAADSLQVQRRGIDDSIYGWKGRFEGKLAPWPASALGRRPRGLPVHGGDERLEAYSADDLFEGAVVAVCRDEEAADRDLRGVFEIFAGQPAQAEAGGRGGLQQKGADVRLLVTLTAQLDGVMGLDFGGAVRLPVDEAHQRAQEQVRQDDEPGGNPAGGELSGAGEGSDHRRAPERRGGVEAGHIDPLTQDHARSEKADARNDLSRHPRRTVVARDHRRKNDEACCADRDEGVGPQSRHALQPLPLETNQAAEQHGDPEADGDFLRLHASALCRNRRDHA